MTLMKLLDDYSILIPALQRNYVHGRDDAHAKEVREHFVKSLDKCINGSEMNLDIIYGIWDKERNVLIPIDGQQRLTTLWLAAVYATSTSKDNASRLDLLSKLSRFSYESRPLAATFCRWLTSGANVNYDTALLQAEDCWGEDPTVQSMITTLRLIHSTFSSRANVLLEVLRGDKIHFEFSEVHGKDSDLYVKINARGKQLTQWENFKGVFASHLTNDKREIFKRRIEELSDKYFGVFNAIPDEAFFSLFGRIADYVLRTVGAYDLSEHENLSTLAKGIECYVPVEEFDLKHTAERIVSPVLRILEWTLSLDRKFSLWYWEREKPRPIAKTVFAPENDNERDFALFLFEYFSKERKNCDGLCENSCRALRLVANILENVNRERAMWPADNGYSPKKHFNRIAHLELFGNSDSLYGAQGDFSESAPMQLNEELAKGEIYRNGTSDQIELLQECESYMHGRVRITLFEKDEHEEKWGSFAKPGLQQSRFETLKSRFVEWHSGDEDRRSAFLRHVISCEPWNIKDQIQLSIKKDSLRNILSTQDDVRLQKTYLDGSQADDIVWSTDRPWRRDWRMNVFEVDDWKDRSVKWHGGTGIYFLYAKGRTNIPYAMPVADWRFDLQNSINKDFAELGKVESVSSNDGGTRSFKCEWAEIGDTIIYIYLLKERVEIMWFKSDGNLQKSDRIEICCDKVDGATLACEIKNRIKKLKNGQLA